ncbi:MAG: hypothetical protein NZO58_10175 [Gemmataceae bacterium]|nr:hypothetical protein [Gemmataceae bacterium]
MNFDLAMYAQLPLLLIVVSLVYSATRHDRWNMIFHEALRWGSRMFAFLVGIGVVLFLVAAFIDSR